MNFYEFIEAIARVAEKVSIIVPKGPYGNNVPDIEARRLMDLHDKLDGVITYLYFRLGETIKKDF